MVQKPISQLGLLFHYACYSCTCGYAIITEPYHYYLYVSSSIYLHTIYQQLTQELPLWVVLQMFSEPPAVVCPRGS